MVTVFETEAYTGFRLGPITAPKGPTIPRSSVTGGDSKSGCPPDIVPILKSRTVPMRVIEGAAYKGIGEQKSRNESINTSRRKYAARELREVLVAAMSFDLYPSFRRMNLLLSMVWLLGFFFLMLRAMAEAIEQKDSTCQVRIVVFKVIVYSLSTITI